MIAVFLTFFAVVVAIVGYFGFQRFRDIEAKAEEHAGEAERFVDQIKAKRDEAESLLKDITAETVRNDPDKASEVVETVQQNSAASLIARATAAAISFQQQGEIEQAIEKWGSIANVAEGVDSQLQARAWFSVGYLHAEEDNWEAAIDACDKALDLKPDYVEAYNNRGVAKDNLGRHEAALADYAKAIRLKPDMAEAYNNRGVTKRVIGQYEAALADFDKAIQLKPDMAKAYSGRGSANVELGRHEAAFVDFDKAIQLKPDHAEAYMNRGVAKSELGRHEAALVDFDKAIQLKSDHAEAYNNRGVTKEALGRLDEAREDYQKALAFAQESGNEALIARVQRNLSQLDNDKAP